jgi:hypothetical protein
MINRIPRCYIVALCGALCAGCGEAGTVGGVVDPESDMVDVPEEVVRASSGGLRPFANGAPTILFLNFEGAQIIQSYTSDAAANKSFIGGGTVPPFNGDQATKSQVVALVKQLYAAYNIQIVTTRPASGDYDMAMIGGTPAHLDLGYSTGVVGVAPMDCGNQMPRDIAFVFSDSIKALSSPSKYAEEVAETAAHESAHTYGLPHSADGCDLMSYSSCATLKTFLDKTMSMQSDSYGKCGLYSMNSHQLLLAELGPSTGEPEPEPPPADTQPPQVTITSPAAGAKVSANLTVKTTITDNTGVSKADLRVDGQVVSSRASAPFDFNVTGLGVGQHTLVVEAYDPAGNKGSATVAVSVDAPAPPPPVGDSEPPTVSITSPAAGATVNPSVTVQAAISDNTGVTKADLLVDGVVTSSVAAAPYNFSVTLSVGQHTLAVEAYDAAENKGSATVTVVADQSEPPAPEPPPDQPAPPSPGTYGATCEVADDCDTKLCAEDADFAGRYCTQTCVPDNNSCPDGAGCYPTNNPSTFVCGPPAQRTLPASPEGDMLLGGCTLGGGAGSSPALGLVLLAGLALLLRRRASRS